MRRNKCGLDHCVSDTEISGHDLRILRTGDEIMAYQIIASLCTSCGACELDCPNSAISMGSFVYVIDPNKCTECKGFHDQPQCASVCPVPDTCVPAVAA
jgi:ferredoxin